MKKKKSSGFMGLFGIFIFISSVLLYSQSSTAKTTQTPQPAPPTPTAGKSSQSPPKTTGQPVPSAQRVEKEKESGLKTWLPVIIGAGGFIFGIYQYSRRRKNRELDIITDLRIKKKFQDQEKESAEGQAKDWYRSVLKNNLNTMAILGSPDIDSKAVKLEDAFVSLCISETGSRGDRGEPFDPCGPRDSREPRDTHDSRAPRAPRESRVPGVPMEQPEPHLSPEEVMKRAFQGCRLLVITGDPGSGKTTLLKYYSLNCLDRTGGNYRKFGFREEVLPVYFPLRELEFDNNDEPVLFPDNLARWAERSNLNISAGQFQEWLREENTLVLLDGLDEISNKEQRRKACQWIESLCNAFEKTRLVVTSRATGLRKLDGMELGVPHLRADIMDFSLEQQTDFLQKWFRAVFLTELPPADRQVTESEWKDRQEKAADRRSKAIIDFLNQPGNKAVRELAAVPMLLQIMAILWKDHQHLPESRSELYDAALNYLLDYRDRKRDIKPVLRAEKARRVLAPVGLWMQEKVKKDEVSKVRLHGFLQSYLNRLTERPAAEVFCENLRDRAGLIVDYDKNHYIFRHKSFREFLAGLELVKEAQYQDRLETLVTYFDRDWWEETLRFFMSKADDEIFDRFMRTFFKSKTSRDLDDHRQDLLRQLVLEAPQKRIDALIDVLNSDTPDNNQKRYVLDCLKTIGTPEAVEALKAFIEKGRADKVLLDRARDIVAEYRVIDKAAPGKIEFVGKPRPGEPPAFFRNPYEDHVEYLRIPGETYKYSVSQKMETVPDLYFCKYPVTNKRYRRFISYLAGREKELREKLPLDLFAQRLLEFSASVEGYSDYLGKDPRAWADRLRSRYDEEKKFKGEDQPVVGVTWYGARAYCYWLSCLEALGGGVEKPGDITRLVNLYRLPTEKEWEWAAGGPADEPEGKIREYPWPKDKGEPNPNLANYNNNVGATTPVGRYPEGATPHGLMDMAGNVWEWMENLYEEGKQYRAFRGGSWSHDLEYLRCSARVYDRPGNLWDGRGFRVLRSQSF